MEQHQHQQRNDSSWRSWARYGVLAQAVFLCPALVPPAAATDAPPAVVIGLIGDYGYGGSSQNPYLSGEGFVARLVKGWNPDFIMTLGDNNYPLGSADTIDANIGQFYHEYIYPYQGFYGLGASHNRFFPSLGNHDAATGNGTPYLDYFALPGNERYYHYRLGPIEIFALNSNPSEPDGTLSDLAQAQWLQAHLAASTAPWKLVYFHVPPYSSGQTYGSVTYMQWPFAQWGATAVLSGHEHLYERVLTNQIVYFVNGLGGVPTYPFASTPIPGSQVRFNQSFGGMRIEATDTNIAFEFVTRFNAVIDVYRIPPAPPGFPFFTVYPGSQAVRPGTNVIFNGEADGEGPLSYQWQFNGSLVPDATNSVLALTNVLTEHAGSYAVMVSNRVGARISATATLTVLTEPLILHHPTSLTVAGGTNVTLTVAAEGLGPLSYRWQRNGADLFGSTNAFLLLTNVQMAQTGAYRVLVTDDLASVLSAPADLNVLARPQLVQQPLGQTVVEGGTVVLGASVAPATLPISFRWFWGAKLLTNMILDQADCFFTLSNVQLTNGGAYRVGVTNLAGLSAPNFSSPALLTVLADRDHDGLPDVWEDAHQFRSDDPADALSDADGDGATNREEYLAGTDPRNPASHLQIETIQLDFTAPPTVKLSFLALSNRTYSIEHRDRLDPSAWSRLVDVVAAPADRTLEITTVFEPGVAAERLYRLSTPRLP